MATGCGGAVGLYRPACCVVLGTVDAGGISDFCGSAYSIVLVADCAVATGNAGNLTAFCVGDSGGLAFAVCDSDRSVSQAILAIYFVAACARIDWAGG